MTFRGDKTERTSAQRIGINDYAALQIQFSSVHARKSVQLTYCTFEVAALVGRHAIRLGDHRHNAHLVVQLLEQLDVQRAQPAWCNEHRCGCATYQHIYESKYISAAIFIEKQLFEGKSWRRDKIHIVYEQHVNSFSLSMYEKHDPELRVNAFNMPQAQI